MSQRVRFDPVKFSDVFKAMLGLRKPLNNSSLGHRLLNLVEVRASQINGCGYCVDMHTKDARLDGETEQRLYLVSAWREATCYSDRERAALAWTEAVTKLERQEVPDEVYQEVSKHFDDQELMRLTLAVISINGWNRINIAFKNPAGSYQAGSLKKWLAG